MKRMFVSLVAALMTMAVFAVGRGDGSNRSNAKEYNWQTGVLEATAGSKMWYHIDLASVTQMEDPTLTLLFRNTGSVNCSLDLTVFSDALLGEGKSESRHEVIAANDKKTWSKNVSMLKNWQNTQNLDMYLCIDSKQDIVGLAEVYETEDVDDVCMDAVPFDMLGQDMVAGLQWYEMNLTSVRAQSDKVLVLKYINTGASTVHLTRGLSPECPTTGVTARELVVPAGATVKDTLSRLTLTLLPDFSYMSIEANGAIRVETEVVTKPAGIRNPSANSYTALTIDRIYDDVNAQSSEKYFKIKKTDLMQNRHQPRISFLNQNGSEEYTVTVDIFFDKLSSKADYSRHTITVPAGEVEQMVFAMNMVQQLDTTDGEEYVYARVKSTKKFDFVLEIPHIREKDDCKYAADFDWSVTGNFQNTLGTKWYAVDISEAKRETKNIELWLVNVGSARADVTADVTFMCPYTDAQSVHRTVMPNDTTRTVIAYGTYGMFSNDTVWIGLTTDQPVWFGAKTQDVQLKEPDEACLSAVDFNWVGGHIQSANETVWYRVALDTLRKTELLPRLSISNRTASAMTIWAELTVDCPDSIPNEKRSLSILPAGVYSKQISRDMVNRFDPNLDYVYVRLVANQDFSFRLELEKPGQGSDCRDAYDFNWISGNDQAADKDAWYAIDLREAKAGNKDVRVSVYNRSNYSGLTTAELAPTCPCETSQKQNVSIGANRMLSKVIPHSILSTFDEMFWIRLSGNVDIHFEAELIDAAPITPIEACSSAQVLEYGREYEQNGDTAWFVVAMDTLLRTALIPQVVVTNGDARQTICAEVSFACPVTATMMSRSLVLDANQSQEKQIERSICESVASMHDSVWIRLSGTSNYRFRVDLVDSDIDIPDVRVELSDCDSVWVDVKQQWYYESAEWEELTRTEDGRKSYTHYFVTVNRSYPRFTNDTTICEGDALEWNGDIYTTPGTYRKNLKTVAGCDSIVYLKLSTYPTYKDTIRAKICEGESYTFNGRVFTETCKYRFDTVSQYGCDSIVVLLLTVQTETHLVREVHGCDSVMVLDRWFFEDGKAVDFDPTDLACNSTITYRYYVHKSFHKDTIVSIQEGDTYVWHGRGLNETGWYYDSLKTQFGCDSIYRLHLYVLPGTTLKYTYDHNCPGDVFELYDQKGDSMRYYYNSAVVLDTLPYPAPGGGPLLQVVNIVFNEEYNVTEPSITIREGQIASWKTYRLGDIPARSKTEVTEIDTCYTFTSSRGCDSIRCVRVNILPRTYGSETVDICDDGNYPYTYDYGHRWYTKVFDKDGVYTVTRDNFLGGDSVVTIHLHVHPNINKVDSVVLAVGGSFTCKIPGTGRDTVFYATSVGAFNHLLQNEQSQYGCDSTYSVHIEVYNPAEGFESIYGENGEHQVKKLIYQNHLYIIVDDRRYDAMGRRVK